MRKNKYLNECIHKFTKSNGEIRTKLVVENNLILQTAIYHLAMCEELGHISNDEGWDFNFILNFNLPDLEASLLLATYGYYSQAKSILRMVLDTAVREIYFEEITPAFLAFEKYPVKNRLPPFRTLFEEYLAWPAAQEYDSISLSEKMYFDQENNIKFSQHILNTYKYLCAHIHPGGTAARVVFINEKRHIGNVADKDALVNYMGDFFNICIILCIFVLLLESIQSGKKPLLFKQLYKKEYDIISKINAKLRNNLSE
ncbi:MAG: hypothetical protein ACOCRX_05765 [Candidatus Woesearchaeota archaeon]